MTKERGLMKWGDIHMEIYWDSTGKEGDRDEEKVEGGGGFRKNKWSNQMHKWKDKECTGGEIKWVEAVKTENIIREKECSGEIQKEWG